MVKSERASESSILRLSRYHCFLGEMLGVRSGGRVTSRELADELGLSEETVRHDLKHVDVAGRPGAGYELEELYEAIQGYLELTASHPFAIVGNADIARGLTVTFPAATFGMEVAAVLSERAEDIGQPVGDFTIVSLADAAEVLPSLGVTEAIVACAPEVLDDALATLEAAGVTGVLMLTPALRPRHPEGMNVTYFRMPCALKSLAAARGSGESAAAGCCCD